LKRAEIASRDRALEKKKEEMEKRHLKINKLQDTISEIEGGYKQSKARLKILSNEAVEKYSNIKSNDPDFVVGYLDTYYDTLDVDMFNKQLKEIREKYDKLEKPLRDKLAVLESEHKTKKDTIDKQKANTNQESVWIENQQELMAVEYDKQEIFEEDITKHKKELKELRNKYDN